MKKALLLQPLLLATLILAPTRQPTQIKRLVLTHIAVIDTTGGPTKLDMTIVITGDRITELGPAKRVTVPRGAHVVDATGKFLIPGLWDMHVHWYGFDKAYLQLFTANGVTGIRVMWGAPVHFNWRREIEAGKLLGPRMVIASTILDGPKPVWPGSIAVANEAEARQAVIKVKEQGFDFVKVYSLLPREAYFAIADESKKQGLVFVGHVPFSVSAGEASDAGQKSIEHLTGILTACSIREEELRKKVEDAYFHPAEGQRLPSPARIRPLNRMMLETFSPEKAALLFARFKRNRTWQCPTFTVLRSGAFINDPVFRNDPRLKYLPTQLTTAWDPSTDFRFKQRTAEDFDLSRLVYKKHIELVGMMHRAGVEFLAGTDTPNPYCFPGFSLHDELALLVEAGLSPMEALQAATINPARFLGMEPVVGTIETGKLADLLLLDANPLQNITNTKRINAVVINGRLLDRTALNKLLTEVQADASRK
jgi:hypothetical protein